MSLSHVNSLQADRDNVNIYIYIYIYIYIKRERERERERGGGGGGGLRGREGTWKQCYNTTLFMLALTNVYLLSRARFRVP